MLRICGSLFGKQASQMIVATRLTATDPSSGSINAAHGKFAEREQALENAYFRKINEELLEQLHQRHSDLEKQSDNIEEEQKRLGEQIKKLQKQREQLAKRASNSTKSSS